MITCSTRQNQRPPYSANCGWGWRSPGSRRRRSGSQQVPWSRQRGRYTRLLVSPWIGIAVKEEARRQVLRASPKEAERNCYEISANYIFKKLKIIRDLIMRITLKRLLGEGKGLLDGLGIGLGRGLRSFLGTLSPVSSSSFVGVRGKRSPVDSLGGTKHVSDTLRGIFVSSTLMASDSGLVDCSFCASVFSSAWFEHVFEISPINFWNSSCSSGTSQTGLRSTYTIKH